MESFVYGLREQLVAWRRDFHKHAEPAWQEIRTAAVIAEILLSLGFSVRAGEEVVSREGRMGVPSAEILQAAAERAAMQGVAPQWIERLRFGFSGVVGELDTGREGPTIAMRFDIDANDLSEDTDDSHRPARLGFVSVNRGACHACGHDGHAAIGLGMAAVLTEMKEKLRGKFRLIFQPAEEGARGAKAMVAAGVLDSVDYLVSGHIGFAASQSGHLICGTTGFLATSKADVFFKGVPSHAGAKPEEGRNALLAAAGTSLALHALPRHSAGSSRVNVGVLNAGEGRNIIPAKAKLSFETRGVTTEVNDYLMDEALRVIAGQAMSYGVSYEVVSMGGAPGATSNPDLVARIRETAARVPGISKVTEVCDFGASDDVTYMMDHVQGQGGQATYMMFGANMAAPHHNGRFDFDEEVLVTSVHLMSLIITAISGI
jgi:aminobenzoyl-glutamate utilization protein A